MGNISEGEVTKCFWFCQPKECKGQSKGINGCGIVAVSGKRLNSSTEYRIK